MDQPVNSPYYVLLTFGFIDQPVNLPFNVCSKNRAGKIQEKILQGQGKVTKSYFESGKLKL